MNKNYSKKLFEVLQKSWDLGFLGPKDNLQDHIDHAELYYQVIMNSSTPIVDLGSGGGLPALPLIDLDHSLRFVLVEASSRRYSFLHWAVNQLEASDRVKIFCERAEQFGHRVEHRSNYEHVIARSFGPPAQTIECAIGLLSLNGSVTISEPPGGRQWPLPKIEELGLAFDGSKAGLAQFIVKRLPPKEIPRPFKDQKKLPIFTI